MGLCLFSTARVSAKDLRIFIYHTNDIHGWILSRTNKRKKLVGGVDALANYFRKAPGPKLLIDAGDWFQGTPEGTLTKGQALVSFFNAVPYDVVEVGNHDFDFGEAQLQKLVQALHMPVLGANVYSKKTGKRVPYLKPFIIKKVAGVKLGIFGLLTTNMPNLTFHKNIKGLKFRREIDEAKDEVKILKARGATVIIAVTHVGIQTPKSAPFEDDRFIASHVPGIDLIIGGHSHTLLPKGVRDLVHHTLIVQTGSYLIHVGKVTLWIDPQTKKVVRSKARVVKINPKKMGSDPQIKAILARYQQEVGKKMNQILGKSPQAFKRKFVRESSLGDWAADCLRSWAKTDVAFQNSGGLRADLPKGPVTWRDIFDLMPFDNYITTMSLSGQQVREILEQGVSGNQGIIQVSGIRFSYDPKAPIQKRVQEIWIDQKLLVSSASYSAATLNFLALGGDGYKTFLDGKNSSVAPVLVRDIFAQCAEKSLSRPKRRRIISKSR